MHIIKPELIADLCIAAVGGSAAVCILKEPADTFQILMRYEIALKGLIFCRQDRSCMPFAVKGRTCHHFLISAVQHEIIVVCRALNRREQLHAVTFCLHLEADMISMAFLEIQIAATECEIRPLSVGTLRTQDRDMQCAVINPEILSGRAVF